QEDSSTTVPEVDSPDALPERPVDFRSFSSPGHFPVSEKKYFPSIHATLTHKDSDAYNLNQGERLLLVFNHNEYDSSREIPPRAGTDRDLEAIRETFEALGFKIMECLNYTASKIEDKLLSISEMDNLSIL
ncbi:Caspase1like, partial [Caligus rogercresseyi]